MKKRIINGFDDRNIVAEQKRLIRNAKGKKYDSNIEDNFFDYLKRINKENLEKGEEDEFEIKRRSK